MKYYIICFFTKFALVFRNYNEQLRYELHYYSIVNHMTCVIKIIMII